MSPSKVKKQNSKKKYTETVNDQWTQNFSGKLKEFKTWTQVKGPKILQPALSYALDWLSPELLGTGFRMFEVSETEIKALIPAQKSNLDSQLEINQGLVTNAAFELARVFIQRQVPDRFFRITGSELSLVKKTQWKDDLNLVLKISQAHLDDFFVNVQKNKNAAIEMEMQVVSGKTKSQDHVVLKLFVQITELLA
jgi:hypothetical protein